MGNVTRINAEHYCGEAIVANREGVHTRPAMKLSDVAMQSASEVTISNGPRKADARSILSVLTLAAQQGARLVLEARGTDALATITKLASLIEGGETANAATHADASAAV